MAHIRRHPVDSSKWQVRYIDPGGRERSKTFRRKVDADRFLIQVEAQKQRGEWIDPDLSATLFADWAHGWITTRTHLKPKTLDGYQSLLRNHIIPRFGGVRLDRIDGLAIEQWVADMQESGLSASRIRQAHRVLSQILKAAVRNRYIPANPADGIPLPRKPKREQLFLTPPEIDRLAAAVDDRYRALVYVLAYGGLRWGEAAALRRRRVDVLRGRVDVNESLAEVGGDLHFGTTKNHRSRTVVIPSFLRDMLNHHLVTYCGTDPDGLVFTASNGSPLRNSNFTKNVWQPALESGRTPGGAPDSRPPAHCRRPPHLQGRPPGGDQTTPRALLDRGDDGRLRAPIPVRSGEPRAGPRRSLRAESDGQTTDKTGQARISRRASTQKPRWSSSSIPRNPLLRLEFPEESVRSAKPTGVGPVGLEPTTNGLKARCSTS